MRTNAIKLKWSFRMKRIFLLITFFLSMPLQSVENIDAPSAFDATNLPTLKSLDAKEIVEVLSTIKNDVFPYPHKHATFTNIKQALLQQPYIQTFKDNKHSLTDILAFSLKTFLPNLNKGTTPPNSYLPTCNVQLSCCPCIEEEYRTTQALFTILAIVEMQQNNNLHEIQYTSIASRHFLNDYIILASLIKLGLPVHLDVNLIDPLYNFPTQQEEKDIIQPILKRKNLPTLPLKIVKILERDQEAVRLEEFKILLAEVSTNYSKATGKESTTNEISTWQSVDKYLQRLDVLAHAAVKTLPKEVFNPHVAILSDSADDLDMRKAIWKDFEKITARINHRANVISILDKYPRSERKFLEIHMDGQKIIDLIQKPSLHTSSANDASGPRDRVPVPLLRQNDLQQLYQLVKEGNLTIENALDMLEPETHKDQLLHYFDLRSISG